LFSLTKLGASGLRLDANFLLGIERVPGSEFGFVNGHPLAEVSTQQLAMAIRKWGGWSYEEHLGDLQSQYTTSDPGADLGYDFTERAAILYACISGDAYLLNYILNLVIKFNITLNKNIHAMQNHDELISIVPQFSQRPNDIFQYKNQTLSGAKLNTIIVNDILGFADKLGLPKFGLTYVTGLPTTFTTIIAMRHGFKTPADIFHGNVQQNIEYIQQGMQALAVLNAMQPGIFMISMWDLLGSWQLLPEDPRIQKWINEDGDPRWLNRPAYDTLKNTSEQFSKAGLPKAFQLFGDLKTQLNKPNSYANKITQIITLRSKLNVAKGRLINLVSMASNSGVGMVEQLPDNSLLFVFINFDLAPIAENIIFSRYLPQAGTFTSAYDAVTGNVITNDLTQIYSYQLITVVAMMPMHLQLVHHRIRQLYLLQEYIPAKFKETLYCRNT